MSENRLPICLCFDKEYEEFSTVLIVSILKSSNKSNLFKFYIFVEQKISSETEEILTSIGIKFEQIIIPTEIFKDFQCRGHISKATYYKLAILDLVDFEEKFVLVLDIDTMLIGDISEVFDFASDDHTITSVDYHHTNLLGAGFYLVNTKINKGKYSLSNFKEVYYGLTPNHWCDQEILNYIFKDDCAKIIPPVWDFPLAYFENDNNNFNTLKGVIHQSQIKSVHYPGSLKPWNFFTDLMFVDKWRDLYFFIYKREIWKKNIVFQFLRQGFVSLRKFLKKFPVWSLISII